MLHTEAVVTNRSKPTRTKAHRKPSEAQLRYSVGLSPELAQRVDQYSKLLHLNRSQAISSLVRAGLESQEQRKREFFKRMRENLANSDPKQEDRMVDEFWDLIMGR